MNVIKKLIDRIKGIFFRNTVEKAERRIYATPYLDTLEEYLKEQSKYKTFNLKKRNAKSVWYGEVESMHHAYILLVSLPDVLSCDITLRYSADDLFYNVKVHDTFDLELTNRSVRKQNCATITLREEGKVVLQIKLTIKD